MRDDRDRQHGCELLAELAIRFRIVIHSYVLMDNHYHLPAGDAPGQSLPCDAMAKRELHGVEQETERVSATKRNK